MQKANSSRFVVSGSKFKVRGSRFIQHRARGIEQSARRKAIVRFGFSAGGGYASGANVPGSVFEHDK